MKELRQSLPQIKLKKKVLKNIEETSNEIFKEEEMKRRQE